MTRVLPPPTYLAECLDYDPASGLLTWKTRPREHFKSERMWKIWNTKYPGRSAFAVANGRGYLVGQLDQVMYLAHRVAYAIAHGAIDEREVDHINGDRSDNRIVNLRLVSPRENRRNAALPTHNTSGHVGVRFREDKGRWNAFIGTKGITRNLGYYDTKEDALAARQRAEVALGFHPNHGRAQCG